MSEDKSAIIREMATDAGIQSYDDIPGWLYELLEFLVDVGWRKEKQ